MSYWLAGVLREQRKAHGIRPSELAGLVKRDQSTISRIEKGKSLPPDIDRYVAAYAQLSGLEDGRVLWQRALEKWWQEGSPPVLIERLETESEVQRLERDLQETAARERAKRARKQSDGKAHTTRTRRAAG